MSKERTILAFIAIAAGLIIASSLFYFYQKSASNKTGNPPSPSPTETLSNSKAMLEVDNPQHESITDQKTTDVKGKSQPGALIVVTTDAEDFVLQADNDGTFTRRVDLSEDENLLTITAYTDSGVSEVKEIAVTYTTEEF